MFTRFVLRGLMAFGLIGVSALPALAADGLDTGDTAWILSATALVLFMTLPGLALFYAGLVQSKNIISVLMHHFAIACLMSVLWVVAGYSLAFSGDGAWFGNLDNMFLGGIGVDSMSGTIPESLFAVFQMTFAIITPALVIGAYVERMKFAAVLIFSVLWLLFVYAPVTHWVWGGGIMAGWGVMDFASGIVGRYGGPCLRGDGRQAPPFPAKPDPAAQPGADDDRRQHAVGRLVRLQRRFSARRRRRCRHGAAGHPYRRCHGLAGMDGH